MDVTADFIPDQRKREFFLQLYDGFSMETEPISIAT
jgi:hypothetical protein